tara:strand:+ start:5652 stop:6716 length:1065 start_codon:yes stop_codon:yes gene_type:complete
MFSSSRLFLFALLLSPLYLWESGLPQIGDFVYALSFLPYLYNFTILNTLIKTWPKTLLLFIIWVAIVSLFWLIYLNDPDFIQPFFYYAFNFIISSTLFIYLIKDQNFLNKISNILFFNSLIVLITIIAKIGMYRNTGTFNNPNQLALFGLFIMSTIQLLNNYDIPKKGKDLFIYITGFLCVLSSLSITAILPTPFFIICSILKDRIKITSLLLSIILLLIPIFLINNIPYIGGRLVQRGGRTGQKIERFIVDRGYIKLQENPQYLIFGAGEGAPERFGNNQEIHSLPANVFFAYGILGILSLGYSLYLILNPFTIQNILLLLPIGFYSLTHMSLRSTFIWILLAIIYFKNSFKK